MFEFEETMDNPNVTLENPEEGKRYFPCPVCGDMLLVKMTFKEKPYCTCLNCGVQLFIRGQEGIKKINSKIGNFKIINDSQNLIDFIDYFNLLKDKLIEIKDSTPLFGNDEDIEKMECLISNQLNILRGIDEKKGNSKN